MKWTALGLILVGAVAGGCTGPTELSNEDVAAKKKELSQESYEKAMQQSGKTAELDAMHKADAEHGARGH